MGAWCHLGRDFIQMPLHGLGVAAGQSLAAAPWHLGPIIVVGGRLRQEL